MNMAVRKVSGTDLERLVVAPMIEVNKSAATIELTLPFAPFGNGQHNMGRLIGKSKIES